MSATAVTDSVDVAAARAGRPDALAVLYRRHAAALYGLAHRLTGTRQDAEDVVHDVFVGLPEALGRYEERGQLAAWLMFVDPTSLRPLRHARSWKQGRNFFVQEFSHDSVSERLHVVGPPAERNFSGSAALPGPKVSPLVVSWSPYSLNALVQALPLERRWRGSVYSVNWISMADRFPAFTPLDLRVTGVERVTVPAGSFDCWKLEVREGPDKFLVWVSKEERWVVMTRHTWSDEAGEWRTEALLTAVAPTPPAP